MATTLANATLADADDIASLLRATWAATYGDLLSADALHIVAREWHHPDLLRGQIANPDFTFVLARTETGALVGVATVKGSAEGEIASVLRLYVRPEYQGQGIGSQLLDVALAAVPRAQRVELQVAEGNPAGLAFWAKQGFRECGHDAVQLGETALALVSMERTIAP